MRQFEVRRLRSVGPPRDLVVILQSDLLDVLGTVVVAPLYPPSRLPSLPRLRPPWQIDGRSFVIAIDRLAAIEKRAIGDLVGSAEAERDSLLRALDVIFTGF